MGEGQRQDNGALFPLWAKLCWTPLASEFGSLRSQQSALSERGRLIKRGSLQLEHWLHIRGPSVMTVLVRKLGTLSRGRTTQAQRCRLSASPQLLPFISFLLPLAANKRPPVPGGRGDTVTQDVPSILDISSMV